MPRLSGLRLERAMASKQYRNGKFHNTSGVGAVMSGNSAAIMADFAFGGRKRNPTGPLPVVDPLPAWSRGSDTGLRITWLGHSSFLLEIDKFMQLGCIFRTFQYAHGYYFPSAIKLREFMRDRYGRYLFG